jgi:drug/metabolite transporter (DMT)-like permease
MKNEKFYKGLFAVAAGYDLFLGLAFFLFYRSIYDVFNIQLPDPAYAHLLAAFVFVQGLGYYFVFLNLKRNVDIVKAGVVYKTIYTAVAFYYWAVGGLPHPMFALFGLLDLIFAVLFMLYLRDYNTVIMEPA